METLLAAGTAAGDIVATGRAVERIADLAERGVQVRHGDLDDPATLGPAVEGCDGCS